MKKLKLLRRLILILIVFGLCATGYYVYAFSPKVYTFSSYEYVNSNIPSELNGFKIAFISDTNLTDKNSIERFQNIIHELNEHPYDMVIFGGDLYDEDVFETKTVSSLLKDIDCKYGKLAILGEKDQSSALEITQVFNNGGFEVLTNETRTLYYKNTSFSLITCNDETDFSKIESDSKSISILVSHQPDVFADTQGKINLQISGHSYGGSIYIPYIGALLAPDGAKTYNHGVYEEKGSTLLVSNGLSGPSSFPYKFLAKNEINFITLKTSSTSE